MSNNNPSKTTEALYALLPAIYRVRDEERGKPLEALISIIAEQVEILQEDLEQRYEDHFIETCAPWVVPYIGELVGTSPLFDATRVSQRGTAGELFPDLQGPSFLPDTSLRGRADVARTISFRRRKATLPMLEDLAHLVTGWAVHVGEMFERIGWSQCVRNHLRPNAHQCPDLRRVERIGRLEGAFDTALHNVDVRRFEQHTGWYGIEKISFFLYRLRSQAALCVSARRVGAAGDFRYHFSPLGNPTPLFSRFRSRTEDAETTSEPFLPHPIRPAAFHADLERARAAGGLPDFTDYYGIFGGAPVTNLMKTQAPDASLLVVADGVPVPPAQIRCMDLSGWRQPEKNMVGIDLRLGRIAFGPDVIPAAVDTYYHHGFSADLGGGTYARAAWLVRSQLTAEPPIIVDQSGSIAGSVATIAAALNKWVANGKPNQVISIADSRTYAEAISIEPADGRWLVIEAADRRRPLISPAGSITITGDHPSASVTFSGLLIEGPVEVSGALGRLRFLHTTLVPGRALTDTGDAATGDPSLIVSGGAGGRTNSALRVELAFSICGPIRVPEHVRGLWILDSIVDGLTSAGIGSSLAAAAAGPPLWIERSTVFGDVRAATLELASETLFTGKVRALRRQQGCVRFSYLPEGSITPRRFRCQPELAVGAAIDAAQKEAFEKKKKLTEAEIQKLRLAVISRLAPSFTSTKYGQPAYAQLHVGCPPEIGTGAEDGSEMGAFCHLKQPQRLANLRARLDEYLPFGLEAGFVFVT